MIGRAADSRISLWNIAIAKGANIERVGRLNREPKPTWLWSRPFQYAADRTFLLHKPQQAREALGRALV
jgi:hypothetical protein